MRSFSRAVLAATIVLASAWLVNESAAAPISTAPRPPAPTPTGVTRERKCGTVPALSYYRFEDSMTDSTGLNAAFVPGSVAPTYTTGRMGKALAFTSGAFAKATLKPLPATWTVAHWFRQASPSVPDVPFGQCKQANDTIISALVDPPSPNEHATAFFAVTSHSLGGLNCSSVATNPPWMFLSNAKTPASPGAWIHVALAFDGTTGRVYRDGKELGTFVPKYRPNIESAWMLGEPVTTSSANTFVGAIDDLRIYGVALAAWQIGQLSAGNEADDCK